jgi:hypothetical protein
VTSPESIEELHKAIEFQFSAMVYVAEDPQNMEEDADRFLKISTIRFSGQQNVFVADKKTFAAYFEKHVGRMDMEITGDTLYIVRGDQPMLLELAGEMEQIQGLWGMFEEYRYDKLEKLYKIDKSELYHLVLFDGGCDPQELENILIWHTFRERDKFGQGFVISSTEEPERYDELTRKWKITQTCGAIFVKRINDVTLDKFRPEYEFMGRFTLDDYTRKLGGGFAKRYVVSQSFKEIEEESDYRLVGNNIDSTWQELNADLAILFYNRKQEELDEEFKTIRDLVQGTCQEEECGEHEGIVEKLRQQKMQMFSLNVSFNDLPSFVIDQSPTLLIFRVGSEDPEELKFKTKEEMVTQLLKSLIKSSVDSDL